MKKELQNKFDFSFSGEKEARQTRNIKADNLADQIIKAFIVKRKKRLIDKEDQNDNISYEESEVRLIFMGITLATLFASISVILMIMGLQNNSPNKLQIIRPVTKNARLKFLSPYVTFMALGGEGHLFTLKQNTDASFQYDWELKLPKVPSHNTGFFVFNDQKAVFVISSNSNQKMTMIGGSKQHMTLANSHIIDNFYYTGSILRVGNFAMVFGGVKHINNVDTNGCTLTTALWSIKRQRWIQGPVLPPKIIGCSAISTGFAFNKTNVVVLFGKELMTYKLEDDVCMDAYTFSFDTLRWNDGKKCLLKAENRPVINTYLTCTTYFDKFSRLYGDIFIIF